MNAATIGEAAADGFDAGAAAFAVAGAGVEEGFAGVCELATAAAAATKNTRRVCFIADLNSKVS